MRLQTKEKNKLVKTGNKIKKQSIVSIDINLPPPEDDNV